MKRMTIDEFEQEVQRLLAEVRNGVQHHVHLDVKIVEEKKIWSEAELSHYTPEQQEIIKRGWSPQMALIFTDVNPDWHLEPDFLPPKEMDTYHDPFADEDN
jgi:hypothetical protein